MRLAVAVVSCLLLLHTSSGEDGEKNVPRKAVLPLTPLHSPIQAPIPVPSPTSCKASVVSNTSITVTWVYPDTDHRFFIWACSDYALVCVPDILSGVQRSVTLTELSPGTPYTIVIRACEIDNLIFSGNVTAHATTFENAPPVTGLEVVPQGTSSLEVRWIPDKIGVTRYELEACPLTGQPCVRANTTDKSSHIIKDLQPDTTYRLSVQAVINIGSYISRGPPAVVTGTTETPGPVPPEPWLDYSDEHSAVLKWKKPKDPYNNITSYYVHVDHGDNITTLFTNMKFEHLTPWTNYTIRVSSCIHYLVCGNFSKPVQFKTDVGAPTAPEHFKVDSVGENWLALSWTPPKTPNGPIDGYKLSLTSSESPHTWTTDSTFYNVTALEPGTAYNMFVFAYNEGKRGLRAGPAASLTATTDAEDLEPPKPHIEDIEEHTAKVKWEKPDVPSGDIASYVVHVVESGDKISTTFTNVTLKNLTTWTNYTVKVQSCDKHMKCGNFSRGVGFTTDVGEPTVPEDLRVKSRGTEWLSLTWSVPRIHNGPIDGYNITLTGGVSPQSWTTEATSWNLTELEPGTSYNVSVFAYNNGKKAVKRGPAAKLTATTDASELGPVVKLTVQVTNVTSLNVSWDRPHIGAEEIQGYILLCNSTETNTTKTQNVTDKSEHVSVLFKLDEQLVKFHCAVWAYGKNVAGNVTLFNATTDGIAAPKNVTLLESTSTSFTFEWALDPKAPNASIEAHSENAVDESMYGVPGFVHSSNNTVKANVTGLIPGTLYKVTLKNCASYCGKPYEALRVTEVAAPSEVKNLEARVAGYVNITLTWKKPEHPNGPLDGYALNVVDADRNTTRTYDVKGNVTTTSFQVQDQFTHFTATLMAYNVDRSKNETLYGNAVPVTFDSTGEGPVPPRPHVNQVEDHSVTLTWEKPEDKEHNITGYLVAVEHGANVSTTNTNVTLVKLDAWSDYTVHVSSCTGKEECGQFKVVKFKTDVDAPSAPVHLNVSSAGTHWVELAWQPPKTHNGPLDGYNVTLKNGSSLYWVATKNTSQNLTQLLPGSAYEVSVYAYNQGKTQEKRGPAVSLTAKTMAEGGGGSKGISKAGIIFAVLIPLICVVLVAAYFIRKRYLQKKRESNSLLNSEGS